jgi:hypothetical protein
MTATLGQSHYCISGDMRLNLEESVSNINFSLHFVYFSTATRLDVPEWASAIASKYI